MEWMNLRLIFKECSINQVLRMMVFYSYSLKDKFQMKSSWSTSTICYLQVKSQTFMQMKIKIKSLTTLDQQLKEKDLLIILKTVGDISLEGLRRIFTWLFVSLQLVKTLDKELVSSQLLSTAQSLIGSSLGHLQPYYQSLENSQMMLISELMNKEKQLLNSCLIHSEELVLHLHKC